MDRSHNTGLAPGACAPKTRVRPSGDSANVGTFTVVLRAAEKSVLSGGKTGKLIASPDDERVDGRVAKNNAMPTEAAATTIQAARSCRRPARAEGLAG